MKPPPGWRPAPPQETSPPLPETSPEAPRPRGPIQTHTTAKPLLGRSAAASFPNPPSVETILAATASFDKPTRRWGRTFLIAGLASLAVLVPCLMGSIPMMYQDISPVARSLLGRADKRVAPPKPSTASISPDGRLLSRRESRRPRRGSLARTRLRPSRSPLGRRPSPVPRPRRHRPRPPPKPSLTRSAASRSSKATKRRLRPK